MTVHVWTDGSCLGNPGGPGGAAALLKVAGAQKIIARHYPATTNNAMELTAALLALRAIEKPAQVVVHTDSKYLINIFKKNGWMRGFLQRGGKTVAGKPVANWELLLKIHEEIGRHEQVTFDWVMGHADHPCNELCDELAGRAAHLRRSYDNETGVWVPDNQIKERT